MYSEIIGLKKGGFMVKSTKPQAGKKKSSSSSTRQVKKQAVAKSISSKKATSGNRKRLQKQGASKSGRLIPGIAIALFSLLFVGSLYQLMRQSRTNIDQLIVQDVAKLQKIFAQIQHDCVISGFEHDMNYIDFLTVEKFVGSEIGSMNLLHPDRWKGPYLKDNFTMQQEQYVVMKTKSGYYIVPGHGVKLSNGKVMGRDVIITPETDIEKMMIDSDALQSAEGNLAARITIGANRFKQGLLAVGTRMYDVGF